MLRPPTSRSGSGARALVLLLAGASLLTACGSGEAEAGGSPSAGPAIVRRTDRSADPALVELRALLDSSRTVEASRVEGLLRGARAADPLEADLLEARWATARGEATRASQLVEKARERAPSDARVYATAAEIHAASGRLETADVEIARGVQACGVTPELERARAITLLCRPGGSRTGLEVLQRALRKDPELPFSGRALGQAHMLNGMRCMSEQRPEEALGHALRALQHDPHDVEVRRFAVECQGALGLFEECLAGYRSLVADGVPLEAEWALMQKRAAVAALMAEDRELALHRFRRARDLGLDPEELGYGKHMLAEAAEERVSGALAAFDEEDVERAEALALEALDLAPDLDAARAVLARCAVWRGLAALRRGDAAVAAGELRSALDQDPSSLEAHQFLGHALYQLDRPDEAAEAWQWVVDTARIEGLELPEPVPLQLARALLEAGRPGDARTALEEELTLRPTAPWADDIRTLLDSLDDGAGR